MTIKLLLVWVGLMISSCIGTFAWVEEALIAPDTEVPPIRVSEYAFTSRDVKIQMRAWAQRMMLAPFVAQNSDKPWGKDAVEFVKESIDDWLNDPSMDDARAIFIPQPTLEDPTTLLAVRGDELISKGCNDPLILFFTTYFHYRLRDFKDVCQNAENAFLNLEQNQKYPRSVAWLAGLYADFILNNQKQAKQRDELDKRIPDLAIQAVQNGDYAGKDDFLFVFHSLFFNEYLDRQHQAFAKVCELPSLPEWARCTLLGCVEIKRGWHDRGVGTVNTVTNNGWKGFEKHLEIAREQLTKAWKLRPNRPEAAAGMIAVIGGGRQQKGDTQRLWFDRAIAAQFDYMPAYYDSMWYYRPRWGGSHELMMKFGDVCAATERYDTKVPRMFVKAVEDIIDDTGDWRALFLDPKIGPRIVSILKTSADNPQRGYEWRRRTSIVGVYSYATGDYKLAKESFEKLNNKITSENEKQLRDYGFYFPQVLKDLEARNAPFADRFNAAEKLYFDKKRDDATTAYKFLLESGTWVKLATTGWECRGGEWEASPDGSLTPNDLKKAGVTAIVAPSRLGACYELRGDVAFTPPNKPDKNGTSFVVLIGITNHGDRCGNCGFYLPEKQDRALAYSCTGCFYDRDHNVKLRLEKMNRFWIQMWNGKVTYYLNGVKICDEYENPGFPADLSQTKFGFAALDAFDGASYKISNIQARLLSSEPETPRKEELVPMN